MTQIRIALPTTGPANTKRCDAFPKQLLDAHCLAKLFDRCTFPDWPIQALPAQHHLIR